MDIVASATALLPNNTTTLERLVRLTPGGCCSSNNNNNNNGGANRTSSSQLDSRPAALTHHAATPFDLSAHLWLLRYGEPGRWYARPPRHELARLRRLEQAGLAAAAADPDMVLPRILGSTTGAGSDMVRVWAGEVMAGGGRGKRSRSRSRRGEVDDGDDDDDDVPCWCFPLGEGPVDAHCGAGGDRACGVRHKRRVAEACLAYYMVTEAPRAGEDEADWYGVYAGAGERGGCVGGDGKVYMVEKVGSREACLVRAYHNAALRGWGTAFVCVVREGVELSEAKAGLDGFERVGGLGALVADDDGGDGRVKIFY
ncbi:hypothetical protein SLS58_006742 [Diplodia intermedia]|uniref:Uncharacterized protein n=1 Tax=Diplodia intermedia TaxID=856260 RepID=A0ABR3TMJ1_9PEZI